MNILLQKTELEGKLKVMLKRLLASLVIFIIGLSLLLNNPSEVRAVSACTSSEIQIGYSPSLFQTEAQQIKLFFQIGNSNTTSQLADKELRLRFGKPRSLETISAAAASILNPFLRFFISDTEYTEATKVDGNVFALELKHPDFKKPGKYSGALEWNSDGKGSWQTFCSDVNFQVGRGLSDGCKIDPNMPAVLRPNSPIKVKFVGSANTNYRIMQFNITGASPGEFLSGVGQLIGQNIGSTTVGAQTTPDGQGRFDNYQINGSSGNQAHLFIISDPDLATTRSMILTGGIVPFGPGAALTGGASYFLSHSCQATLKLSNTAGPPPQMNDDPVDPGNGVGNAVKNSGQISRAAGIPCQENKGVMTAIGCVPTSPNALIQALLQFLVVISGAITLLLMASSAIQMMIQGSDAKSLQAAQQRFVGAASGLLFIIFSVFILKVIGVDILQLPGFS